MDENTTITDKRLKLAELSLKIAQGRKLTFDDRVEFPEILESVRAYDLNKAKKNCKMCWSKGWVNKVDENGIRTPETCHCVIKWYTNREDLNYIYVSERELKLFNRIADRLKKERELTTQVDLEGLTGADYTIIKEGEDGSMEIQFEIESDNLQDKSYYIAQKIKNKEGDIIGNIIDFERIGEKKGQVTALIYMNN